MTDEIKKKYNKFKIMQIFHLLTLRWTELEIAITPIQLNIYSNR
jgi:hypothetical protein